MSHATRINWGKKYENLPPLDLVQLQIESYQQFLNQGIIDSLTEVNGEKGIQDFTGKNWVIKFGNHRFGEAKYSEAEARSGDRA